VAVGLKVKADRWQEVDEVDDLEGLIVRAMAIQIQIGAQQAVNIIAGSDVNKRAWPIMMRGRFALCSPDFIAVFVNFGHKVICRSNIEGYRNSEPNVFLESYS